MEPSEQFHSHHSSHHLVTGGFEPAYSSYRTRHSPAGPAEPQQQQAEEDEEFLAWARLIGQADSVEAGTGNPHRRLVEAGTVGEAAGTAREFGRLREAQVGYKYLYERASRHKNYF